MGACVHGDFGEVGVIGAKIQHSAWRASRKGFSEKGALRFAIATDVSARVVLGPVGLSVLPCERIDQPFQLGDIGQDHVGGETCVTEIATHSCS